MDDTHISDPFLGKTISHYHIESKLGEGGMGIVYKAKDLKLLRSVAIKFLSRDLLHDSQALKRFQHEAIAASAINHPNICTIYEIDSFRSRHFIVMEYVDGRTLNQLKREGSPLFEWQVVNILGQVCDALIAAHEVGIIHRDIKPANIMLCEKTGFVKVMDFGLAKLAAETTESLVRTKEKRPAPSRKSSLDPSLLITTYTGLMGTARYMSPEQINDQPLDHRSDIFSLGIVMYEFLTGNRPFAGANQTEVLENIVKSEPISVLQHNPHINKRWAAIVDKALEKDKEQRFQSVKELADDIGELKLRVKTPRQERKNNGNVAILGKKRQRLLFSILGMSILLITVLVFLLWIDVFKNSEEKRSEFDRGQNVDTGQLEVTTNSVEAYQYFLEGRKAWWRYDNLKAIDYFQMAVDIDSSFAYANALLGVLLRWRDRLSEAELCFQRAEMNIANISDWEKLLVKGFIAYWRDQNEEMANYFEKLIDEYPDKIDGYFGAALAYERLEDYDQAIQVTKRILEIDSTHIAAHANIADEYMWIGDLKQAEKYTKREVELFEASGDLSGADGAYDMLGRIYHLEGKGDHAIINLEKSIELSLRNLDAYRFLAEAYTLEGELEKTEQVLNRALRLPLKINERAEVYSWMARLMVLLGRFVDALSSYQKALNLNLQAENYEGLFLSFEGICKLYQDMNHPELAENEWHDLEQNLQGKTIPDNSNILLSRLLIFFDLDLFNSNFDLAQNHLAKIKKIIGGKNGGYLYRLGQFYYYTGRIDRAQEIFQKQISPNDRLTQGEGGYERYYLALIHQQKKEYLEAIEYCLQIQQVRRITEWIPFQFYKSLGLLSELYESLGNTEEAKKYCEKFLTYWKNADPGIPLLVEVQERLARLQKIENPS